MARSLIKVWDHAHMHIRMGSFTWKTTDSLWSTTVISAGRALG